MLLVTVTLFVNGHNGIRGRSVTLLVVGEPESETDLCAVTTANLPLMSVSEIVAMSLVRVVNKELVTPTVTMVGHSLTTVVTATRPNLAPVAKLILHFFVSQLIIISTANAEYRDYITCIGYNFEEQYLE